jgi:antitoxin component of RelBE/YafQ-DinJ toxin-antitoxin module
MKQNKLIQLRVSKAFKRNVEKIASARGLPTSTFIKFLIKRELKNDPLWIDSQNKQKKKTLSEELISSLRAIKKHSENEATKIIKNLE